MLILRTLDQLSEQLLTSASLLRLDRGQARVVPVEEFPRPELLLPGAILAPCLHRPTPVPPRRIARPGYNRDRSDSPEELCPYKSRHRVPRAPRAEHRRPRSSGAQIPIAPVRPHDWRLPDIP